MVDFDSESWTKLNESWLLSSESKMNDKSVKILTIVVDV